MTTEYLNKIYRIVIDGNNNYRIQFKFNYIGVIASIASTQDWHFDPREFVSFEEAERALGQFSVKEIVKEY